VGTGPPTVKTKRKRGRVKELALRPSAAPLSPWWRRVLAYILDGRLIFAVENLISLALGRGITIVRHQSESHRLVTLLITLVVATVYYGAFMSRTNGRTLGKLALGIRVVRTDGRAMTVARAVWRQVVIIHLIPGLIDLPGRQPVLLLLVSVLVLADALWPLWDRENRALHDMAAGTRVRFA
jgi:uncharacterized RDD family membrane protein YckC